MSKYKLRTGFKFRYWITRSRYCCL